MGTIYDITNIFAVQWKTCITNLDDFAFLQGTECQCSSLEVVSTGYVNEQYKGLFFKIAYERNSFSLLNFHFQFHAPYQNCVLKILVSLDRDNMWYGSLQSGNTDNWLYTGKKKSQ